MDHLLIGVQRAGFDRHPGPQAHVVLGHRLPARLRGHQAVPCDAVLTRVDRQVIVQADVHRYHLAAVGRGHRVAVAAHVDVGVPAHLPGLDVARYVTMGR